MLFQQQSDSKALWSGAVTIILALFSPGLGRADRFPPDPVDELRQALKSSARMLSGRETLLTRHVDAIKAPGDIRRALLLQDWQAEQSADLVERRLRQRLAERFREAVRHTLQSGGTTDRLAALSLLADMGASIRTLSDEDRKGITRALAPDLVALIKQGDTPQSRETAARTLGLIFPDPQVAVPALASLLESRSLPDRRAAAVGLAGLTRVATQLVTRSDSASGARAEPSDLVQTGQAVVPVASQYLSDPDLEVRLQCGQAIQQAALGIYSQVPQTRLGPRVAEYEEDLQQVEAARKRLLPLMRSMADHSPALVRALADADPQVRWVARLTFADLGSARERLELAVTPPEPPAKRDDPLLDALRKALPALARGMADRDPQARLESVEVLESMGPAVAPAFPALLKALADPSLFVRWVATRTLGKAAPLEAEKAVPALAKLLYDPDLDLRTAAAVALEHYGPAAKPALADLVQSAREFGRLQVGAPYTDPEFALVVIHTIEGIGTDARPVIPALAAALTASDPRVRQAVAGALGKFGPDAAEAEPALRRALEDDNPDVRIAASDALLRIRSK
jgi:HEAT repeat protein